MIKLRAEDNDDLWHLEKVIRPGDVVTVRTTRKVVFPSGESERKPVTITLQVEKTEFRAETGGLKILGVITAGRPEEYVQTGEHHSVEVVPGTQLSVKKEWKKHDIDRLKEAQEKKELVHIITLDDREAYVHTIRPFGPVERAHFTFASGKYYAEKAGDKYAEVVEFIKRLEGTLGVAGPGFWPDEFVKRVKEDDKTLAHKLLTIQANDVGANGVAEVIKSDEFEKMISSARTARENKLIEEFTKKLSKDMVAYGPEKVEEALDYGAGETLLVIDTVLLKDREKIEPLLEKAEQTRTDVVIVSHENPESEKLSSFGGIVVILRFSYE